MKLRAKFASEVVAGVAAALLLCCIVVKLSLGVPASWIPIAVCFVVLRYIASGYTSAHPAALYDMVQAGTLRWKASSAALALGVHPFRALEASQPLKGRVHLVTGGTPGGIGYWTAVLLARLGATVVVTCRSRTMAKTAARRASEEAGLGKPTANRSGSVVGIDLELTDGDSIARCVASLKEAGITKLHCVVHNAGIMKHGAKTTTPPELPEPQVFCNFFATQALVDELTPLLQRTAEADTCRCRHVLVSSLAHAWLTLPGCSASGNAAERQKSRAAAVMRLLNVCAAQRGKALGSPPTSPPNSGSSQERPAPFQCYSLSKLGNIFTAVVARDELRGTDVDAIAVHPGSAITDITRDLPRPLVICARVLGAVLLGWVLKSPVEAAFTPVAACLDVVKPQFGGAGSSPIYVHDRIPAEPLDVGTDRTLAAQAVRFARAEAMQQMNLRA
jgi:NAD(P)-dependent dehydrogenase (short-subunit alcohol dehydrogenase family)